MFVKQIMEVLPRYFHAQSKQISVGSQYTVQDMCKHRGFVNNCLPQGFSVKNNVRCLW